LAPWAEQQQKKQSILFVVALTNKPRKVQLAAMGCLWQNISDNKNSLSVLALVTWATQQPKEKHSYLFLHCPFSQVCRHQFDQNQHSKLNQTKSYKMMLLFC
jgi:hypothetical protein